MSARRVHAMLAAGLADLRLLDRWASHPEALRFGGVDPDTVDLAAVRKFAGLTVKVRHNGLRRDLPLTFRLLARAGLEIDLFAAYAADRSAGSRALAATPEQRRAELIAFIGRWHDPRHRDHRLLWDLVRHEDALARLRQAEPAACPSVDSLRPPLRAYWRPRIRGALILAQLTCDPSRIADLLRRPEVSLEGLEPRPAYRGYWRRGGEASVEILDLDLFGYELLRHADGATSLARLSRRLTAGPAGPTFFAAVEQLARLGVIGFPAPASGRGA